MTWLNEYDVHDLAQDAVDYGWYHRKPNLAEAIFTLKRLVDWTNENSDGWPYWSKPSNASKRLQTVLGTKSHRVKFDKTEGDLTRAELTKLYTPIKAFLTRQNVPHDLIIVPLATKEV